MYNDGELMRKDSKLFLEKLLKYREEKNIDTFELHIDFFSDIPNIGTEINVILDELKIKNCISQKSVYVEDKIKIYLTLDGITYFDEVIEEKNNLPIIFHVEGSQINVANDNGKIEATQSNNEEKTKYIVIKERAKTNNVKNSNMSSDSGNGEIIFALICGTILTVCYIKYRFEIQTCLLLVSCLVEFITVLTYCKGKKAGIIYGNDMKKISLFNMISIIIVPLIIGIINMPIYTSKVRLDLLWEQIMRAESWVALFHSEYTNYASSQMIGMATLAVFLICIVLSDIYIVAIINIVEGRKGRWFWNTLLKVTYKGNDNWKKHLIVSLFFIIMSVLFAGGIFPYILDMISKMSITL